MAEVTGTIGNEPVELNNAATEATLKQLLASLKTLNQSVLKTSGGSAGTGGAQQAATALTSIATTAGPLGIAFGALSSAMSVLGGIIGKVMFTAGAVAGAFVNLSEKALEGNAKMSDFYGAIQNVVNSIPILGGVLGSVVGLFQKLAEFQEKNLEAYQSLTEVGVNFGGSLTQLKQASLNAYLTLGEFSELAKKNSEAFLKLGGTVNDGAMRFVNLSNQLQSGDLGTHLRALGYTAVDMNRGLASYIELTGYRTSQDLRNVKVQQQLVSGAAEYLEQLDGLARLTGKSREEQEQALKEASKNAAFQAKLASMEPEERKKALAGMAQAMALGGKGAVDAFQSRLMNVAPDKAGAMFIATAGNMANVIDKSAAMVTDGSKDIKDMGKLTKEGMRAAQQDMAKYSKEGLFAIIRQGGPVADALSQMGITANKAANMTDQEIDAALKKAEVADSEAKAVAEANKAMTDLGQEIMKGLAPIIKTLTPYISSVVTQFAAFIKTVNFESLGNKISSAIEQIVSAFKIVLEWSKNFFTDAGRDKMLNDLKYFFQLALIEIKSALIPWYTKASAEEDRKLLEDQKKSADLKAEAATVLTNVTKESTEAEKLAYQKRADILLNQAVQLDKKIAVATDPMKNFGPAYAKDEQGRNSFDKAKEANQQPPVSRALGSLGSTGKLFEDFGSSTPAVLHGTEAVVTPDQMKQIVSASSAMGIPSLTNASKVDEGNNLSEHLQRLNTLTAELLKYMKETTEYAKRNVDATKALNRNLF